MAKWIKNKTKSFFKNSIRNKLFYTDIFLVFLALLLSVGFYGLSYRRNVLATKQAALQNRTKQIAEMIDIKLDELNSESIKFVFSESFKNIFYEELEPDDPSLFGKRRLVDMFYSIVGPQPPFSQLNLIHQDGRVFYLGTVTNYTNVDQSRLEKTDWFWQALQMGGKPRLLPPHHDEFGRNDKLVISLVRSFSERYHQEHDSVMELQYDHTIFEDIIKNYSERETVFLLDDSGRMFSTHGPEELKLIDEILEDPDVVHQARKQPVQSDGNTICAREVKIGGLWVVSVLPTEKMLEGSHSLRQPVLVLMCVTLLTVLLISLYTSNKFTKPVIKLQKEIDQLQLQTMETAQELQPVHEADEIQQLYQAFNKMKDRLAKSVEEVVQARYLEREARQMAYQAQIEPHFLYNILYTISIYAKSGENKAVYEMCKDLCDMMRYSFGKGGSNEVTVEEDLEHTLHYVSLMKRRYPTEIAFEVDVPAGILVQIIPKLTLQPLVENCMKYGMNQTTGTWNITVSGRYEGKYAVICVADRGKGFSECELAGKFVPNPEKENSTGIGLENVKNRLKLWNHTADLVLKNRKDGGSAVEIWVMLDE